MKPEEDEPNIEMKEEDEDLANYVPTEERSYS
jgi:hypothetical protein